MLEMISRSLTSEKPEEISGTGAGLFKFESTQMASGKKNNPENPDTKNVFWVFIIR